MRAMGEWIRSSDGIVSLVVPSQKKRSSALNWEFKSTGGWIEVFQGEDLLFRCEIEERDERELLEKKELVVIEATLSGIDGIYVARGREGE